MEQPLTYLKHRTGEDWLIGDDTHQLNQLTEQFFQQLTQQSQGGTPPKILLAEQNPLRFLAAFLAAVAAGCPVFLCNPNWAQQEWQQVFELVQPDLIFGQEANPLLPILPSAHLPIPHSGLIMIPTGGSSGKIRFAMHTWETLMASVRGFYQYFGEKPINSFCVLPLYHVSGLMQFLRSLTTGGQLVILPFKALVAGEGQDIDPTDFFISLVPTQLARLLPPNSCQELGTRSLTAPLTPQFCGQQNQTSFPSEVGGRHGNLGKQGEISTSTWLSRFQAVLLGGAPAWSELLEQARVQNIPLAPTYGMTETASQIVTLQPQDFLSGNNSSGQVLPHAQVTIRTATGEILGANQTGIITIQTDSLAMGYYPAAELIDLKSQLSVCDRSPATQTLKTDDLGFFDDQGYLTIVGRCSNKIITGGENVFPPEVEAAIRSTQLVSDVCVIGLGDRYWGQVVTAVYVPSSLNVSPVLLQAAVGDKLSKFKQPKHWIPVERLPRNDQGKINYEQVKNIAAVALASKPLSIADVNCPTVSSQSDI